VVSQRNIAPLGSEQDMPTRFANRESRVTTSETAGLAGSDPLLFGLNSGVLIDTIDSYCVAAKSARRGQRSLPVNNRPYWIAGSLPGNDVNV
jgi:hypothetical protein